VNHYQNGWLDVPEKYAYLKNNANMCDPTASCKKKALSSTAAAKQTKKGPQGPGTVHKGKGKAARLTVQDEDEDEDEEDEGQNNGQADDGEESVD
jgi:hypothetical protein